jgi:antirestriction protein
MQHITNQLKGKTMKTEIDLTADIIDLRDIIERVEELENQLEGLGSEGDAAMQNLTEEWQELQALNNIMEELKGYGGDEQWRGDWYPITLIRESYFTEYTREMLEDCGTIPRDLPAWVHIDWEATAREVKMDYSYISIGEMDYLYR